MLAPSLARACARTHMLPLSSPVFPLARNAAAASLPAPPPRTAAPPHSLFPSLTPPHTRTHHAAQRLVEYDARQQRATVEYRDRRLAVDTTLLDPCDGFVLGRLFQFIGETSVPQQQGFVGGAAVAAPAPVLRARIAQDVDGMDTSLFERALEVRRRFLAERLA